MMYYVVFLPFTSTAVRYLVNYEPKEPSSPATGDVESGNVQDAELAAQPQQPTSGFWKFFGIAGAINQTEGLGGLFKGLVPSTLTAYGIPFILMLLRSLSLYISTYLGCATVIFMAPTPFYIQINYHNVITAMLLYIPCLTLTYRAILTPHRLPWFSRKPWHTAKESLQVLLTPDELRQPWRLFLIPDVISAQLLHVAISFFTLPYLNDLILPRDVPFDAHMFWRIPTKASLLMLVSCIRAPLWVIITRLVVQGMPLPESTAARVMDGLLVAEAEERSLGSTSSKDGPKGALDEQDVVEADIAEDYKNRRDLETDTIPTEAPQPSTPTPHVDVAGLVVR
ncbi:hypothetical protein ONZ45_g10783 [Pleurotus djamor]|nr:hypothetical protein ONZ45_g10783 [Pleurotus djamor]